jgi:3-phenylpropionate/cinnamic acid dioxygenase small subunit
MSAATDSPLLDELAVRRTLERYMRFNDDRRLDDILALFAPDAVYQVGGRKMTGLDEIRRFFTELGYRAGRPHWHDDGQLMVMPRSAHVLSNPVIDVDGDVARAESDFVVLDRDESGHGRFSLIGRYRDRLARVGETWVFTERTGVSMARCTAPDDAREPTPWTGQPATVS